LHTPSTPTVNQPASATDPRFSTSGILNAHIKEQNRQGLLSTYGGRTGQTMNINKFAEKKIYSRDPSAVPVLEKLAQLYKTASDKSNAPGVGNDNTSSKSKAKRNIAAYNESVDAIDAFLASYSTDSKSNLTKSTGAQKAEQPLNYDNRVVHANNYGAGNKNEIKTSVNNVGINTAEVFNQVAAKAKKQNKVNPTK